MTSNVAAHLVKIEDFKVIRPLGGGGFSQIWLVENIQTGEKLVAKVNLVEKKDNPYTIISREIGILIRIKSPTVVKFYGFSLQDFNGDNNATIFMEYKENGCLEDLLIKERESQSPHEYDDTAKQIILCGVAHAMMTLHSRRIIHRDLKPGNVLLDSNYYPYLTDFGLSKFLDPDNSKSHSCFCGTTAYIAPEIHNGDHYSLKADVYSFGILMFEVLTGESAFDNIKRQSKNKQNNILQFAQSVINGCRPRSKVPIKQGLQLLMEQCWSHNPKERPTFKQIFHKLSLSLDDDDDTIVNAVTEVLAQMDYYEYCLDNVDTDRLLDYVEFITKQVQPVQLQKRVEQQAQRIAELEKLIQDLQNEISTNDCATPTEPVQPKIKITDLPDEVLKEYN